MPWFIAKVKEVNSKIVTLHSVNGETITYRREDFKKICSYFQEEDFLVLERKEPGTKDQQSFTIFQAQKLSNFQDMETLREILQAGNPDMVREARQKIPIQVLIKIDKRIFDNWNQSSDSEQNSLNVEGLSEFDRNAIASIQKPAYKVGWEAGTVCGQLTSIDKTLASFWVPPSSSHPDHILAKMLSARLAEKLTKKFYENLGHQARDVSVTQLDKNQVDWKKYDLLIDGVKPVDVKNARTPVSNKAYYVDYCVPHFKRDREDIEVVIAGVYSPYLRLGQMVGGEEIFAEKNNFIFLGETSLKIIQQLEREFSTNNIQIKIYDEVVSDHFRTPVIPPWLFDYSREFYKEQDLAREVISNIEDGKIPSRSNFPQKTNPISVTLVSGKAINPMWLRNPASIKLIEKLQDIQRTRRILLPDLYLSILVDFLENINNPKVEYFDPLDYRYYFFAPNSKQLPLGIRDPLNIIYSLIENLRSLWANRNQVPWENIFSIKIRGLGIIQGVTKDKRLITIMAYCGGYIFEKGPCGNYPLIVGNHKICPICKKLICDKCDFCSQQCSRRASGGEKKCTVEDEDDLETLGIDIPWCV